LVLNFLHIEQFSEISGSDRVFLSGRRGSGKSAIARMLELSPSWKYARSIQGERGEYGEYMSIVQRLNEGNSQGATVNVKQAVRRLWTWVLPVVAMQTVLQRADPSEQESDALQAMRTYLASLPGLHVDSSIGHLLSHTFNQGFQAAPRAPLESYLLDITNARLFAAAMKGLQQSTTRRPTLTVLDTLESYRIFQQHMIDGLRGVVEAIIGFLADERMHGIAVKFFVPAEIYEKVMAEFPAKVRPSTVFMRWRAADLITMLARRYLSVLAKNELLEAPQLLRLKAIVEEAYQRHDGTHLRTKFWYDTHFLPVHVENKRGRREDCFAYILRHTMRRPRDLITGVMQAIVNAAVHAGEFPYVTAASVIAGVHNAAAQQQILGEALAPYEETFSDTMVTSARDIFYGRPVLMTGQQLRRFAKELYSLNPLAWIEPDDFVTMLIRCGVIGVLENQESTEPTGPYCKAKFEHLMEGHLPLANRLKYCVHPVMGDAFAMSPLPNASVYPMPMEDRWLEEASHIGGKSAGT
jgi:hypothetical protein